MYAHGVTFPAVAMQCSTADRTRASGPRAYQAARISAARSASRHHSMCQSSSWQSYWGGRQQGAMLRMRSIHASCRGASMHHCRGASMQAAGAQLGMRHCRGASMHHCRGASMLLLLPPCWWERQAPDVGERTRRRQLSEQPRDARCFICAGMPKTVRGNVLRKGAIGEAWFT